MSAHPGRTRRLHPVSAHPRRTRRLHPVSAHPGRRRRPGGRAHRSAHRRLSRSSEGRAVRVPALIPRDLHHDRLTLERSPVQRDFRRGRLILLGKLDKAETPRATVVRVPHSLRAPHLPEAFEEPAEHLVGDVIRQLTDEELARVDLVPVAPPPAAAASAARAEARSRAQTPRVADAQLAEKRLVLGGELLVRTRRGGGVVLERAIRRGMPAVAANLARHQLRRRPVPGAGLVQLRQRHASRGGAVAPGLRRVPLMSASSRSCARLCSL